MTSDEAMGLMKFIAGVFAFHVVLALLFAWAAGIAWVLNWVTQ